jgi:hypothetical protein
MMGTGVRETFTLLWKNKKAATIDVESVYGNGDPGLVSGASLNN